MIDTAKDARLGGVFMNWIMRAYPAFVGFYGMEETIERIVDLFLYAAQACDSEKNGNSLGPMIEEKYGIPRRCLAGLMSARCYKRLEAFGGDISRFRVRRPRKATTPASSQTRIRCSRSCGFMTVKAGEHLRRTGL
jgi:serine protein kinase